MEACWSYCPSFDMNYQYFTAAAVIIAVLVDGAISFYYSLNNFAAFVFGIIWLLIGGIFTSCDCFFRRRVCLVSLYAALIFYFPAMLCIVPNRALYSINYEYGVISLAKVPVVVAIILMGQGFNWLVRHGDSHANRTVETIFNRKHKKTGLTFIIIGFFAYIAACYGWYVFMTGTALPFLMPEEYDTNQKYWNKFSLITLIVEQAVYFIFLMIRWLLDYTSRYSSLYTVLISCLPIFIVSLPVGILLLALESLPVRFFLGLDDAETKRASNFNMVYNLENLPPNKDHFMWDCCFYHGNSFARQRWCCCDKPVNGTTVFSHKLKYESVCSVLTIGVCECNNSCTACLTYFFTLRCIPKECWCCCCCCCECCDDCSCCDCCDCCDYCGCIDAFMDRWDPYVTAYIDDLETCFDK